MKHTLLTISVLLLSHVLLGQITDDSTKQVYSAKTTKIIYERDIKNSKPKERHPDTTLYRIEQFTEMDISGHRYQDLGVNGTAMYPIFYPLQTQIGRRSGISAYDPYMIHPGRLQVHDTKSPFIDVLVAFGGKGRSVVDFTFSRNVDKDWNVGFDVYRITSDKQIGKAGQQDRNVIGTVVDFHTYYKHKALPYSAIFSLSNMDFDIRETGGVYLENPQEAPREDFFNYAESEVALTDAFSTDKRLSLHLYHEYRWTKPLQFYHQIDYTKHNAGYRDFSGSDRGGPFSGFYKQFLFDPDSVYELFEWRETTNEVGIKGNLSTFFYRAYLKRRDVDLDMIYIDPTDHFAENFLGGYARFDWRDKFDVEAWAEIMQTGEFQLTGALNSDLIFASYKSQRYKPTLLSERYFANNHYWDKDFVSGFSNEVFGGFELSPGPFKLRPTGRILSMDQFIYYDQGIEPRQSDELAVLTSLGGEAAVKITTNKQYNEAFHIENEVYYTVLTGGAADKLRVPDLFYNGRIYWRGLWFKNTLQVELGFDVHGKTRYFAHAYAPEIQQFYLQDDLAIESFITLDAFFNMRVNNFYAFAKLTNANQQNLEGYYVSPFYPGQAKTFDMGFRWRFFD